MYICIYAFFLCVRWESMKSCARGPARDALSPSICLDRTTYLIRDCRRENALRILFVAPILYLIISDRHVKCLVCTCRNCIMGHALPETSLNTLANKSYAIYIYLLSYISTKIEHWMRKAHTLASNIKYLIS